MKPFSDFIGQLRIALGAANPKLVNRLSTVTNPTPTAGTSDAFRRRNTKGTFEAAGFSGRAQLCYNRINLPDFLGTNQLFVTSRLKPATTVEALPLINRKYRLELKAEDIIEDPISWDVDSGIGSFILAANASSIGLMGQVQMRILPGPDTICDVALNSDLGLALYPSGNNTKGQAQLISYPCDTSAYNADLSSWITGQTITTPMLEIVRAITNLDWAMAEGDYSFSGASITYAGPVRPGIDIPKTNFTRIVTIRLGDACSNFAGELTLYHNPN